MIRTFTVFSIFLLAQISQLLAQTTTVPGPSGSGAFGLSVTLLPNGNYVVADPYFSEFQQNAIGAVHLYDGKTHSLISTLKGGAALSQIGSGGIVVLSNGNFVVVSPHWASNVSFPDYGAVTWVNGTTGKTGYISSANSLVGSMSNHMVGSAGVTALTNGNYVVCSPHWSSNSQSPDYGAATWCNGSTGLSGNITASNSLTGAYNDQIGSHGACALSNGNYVVLSPGWQNQSVVGAYQAGAATWGDGTRGQTGLVSVSNSLVGSWYNDQVGDSAIALSNGNYVIYSRNWNNGGSASKVGAVSWGDGKSGTNGVVSASNSIVGTNANDQVSNAGVYALPNGNYVITTRAQYPSPRWGAVTWGNGAAGTAGVISSSNSLLSRYSGEDVGSGGITILNNGNYVVSSLYWQNGSIDEAGAATWCNGKTGLSGFISLANSLVGNVQGSHVGRKITALQNGNYVVCSPEWTTTNYYPFAGAATWGDGTKGIVGLVAKANSLVGKDQNAYVGVRGVTALANGHYVVSSPWWAAAGFSGAVTWCDGTHLTSDSVSEKNSLFGINSDIVGSGGVVALANGNYVVISPYWKNGMISNAGAVTWCDGNGVTSDTVSATNSLVGGNIDDMLGNSNPFSGVTALTNGNYVVASPLWDNGSIVDAGALTFGDGMKGISGLVTPANSLIGSVNGDRVGNHVVVALPGGHYIARLYDWDNGSVGNAGAVTWGNGSTGVAGPVTACNSVLGTITGERLAIEGTVYDSVAGQLIVGKEQENIVAVFSPCGQKLASSTVSSSYVLSGNSTAPFVSSGCQIISALTALGASPVSGGVTSTVYLVNNALNFSGQALVRRHYDLSPDSNASTATGRVTLYFAQSDFDDFNNVNTNGVNLPTGPSDATGISALRISQHHGTSATGDPGSYSGWTGSGPAVVEINPADADIIWNAQQSRWEVNFDVTGFSGFFVHTDIPLNAGVAQHSGSLSIAPVPATDQIIVRNSDAVLNGTEALVCDIQGREVQRFVVSAEKKINISSIPAGVYTIKFQNGMVQRIVKR